MFYEKAWLAVSALFHPKSCSVGLRSRLAVKFFYTKLSHPCLYGHCFVHWCALVLEQEWAIPKQFPQCRENKIVQNASVCWRIKSSFLCDWGCHNKATPSTPLYSWYNAVRQVTNTDSFTGWPDREEVINCSRNHVSSALVMACYTPLHATLYIALGDVGLGCSWLTMEPFNLKATWGFEVRAFWLCRTLATSDLHE